VVVSFPYACVEGASKICLRSGHVLCSYCVGAFQVELEMHPHNMNREDDLFAYEDGTDRVFRNVSIQNSDAEELPRRKHTTISSCLNKRLKGDSRRKTNHSEGSVTDSVKSSTVLLRCDMRLTVRCSHNRRALSPQRTLRTHLLLKCERLTFW
jgi:hypothetical protein